MKRLVTLLSAVLLLGSLQAFAHGGVDLGPNGGRLVEFSKDKSLLGEVTLKDGFFHVALLDKDHKPVPLGSKQLTVSGGDRKSPQKPAVEAKGEHFVFKALEGEEYPLVLQLRPDANARPVTARFTYDAATCSACKNPEWLCKCGDDDHDHDHDHDHDKKDDKHEKHDHKEKK